MNTRQKNTYHKLGTTWLRIKRHLTVNVKETFSYGQLRIETTAKKVMYITQDSNKFRFKGVLDYARYEPKQLAEAINQGKVEDYYNLMLSHKKSDTNVWKDKSFEQLLKNYYHERAETKQIIQYS